MALSGDRYKLISVDGGKKWMLFDLIDDPGESVDLAARKPEIVESMRVELEKWIRSCDRSAAGEDYDHSRSG